MFKEGEHSASIATTPTRHNFHTGSAGIKQHERHSPIEKASNSGKCSQRSNHKHTCGWTKTPDIRVTISNEIMTQSWQFWDTQLKLDIKFRIKPNQPIWHLNMPKWIYCWWCYNLEKRDDGTRSPGRKQYGPHLLAENRGWRLVDEHTLDAITSRVNKHMQKSQPAQLQINFKLNPENNGVDTQTSDIKHTWKTSGKHTQTKAIEHNQQLDMISAPTTGRMSSVPTSAPSWRMVSVTARAPDWQSENATNSISSNHTHFCLPKQVWMTHKMNF